MTSRPGVLRLAFAIASILLLSRPLFAYEVEAPALGLSGVAFDVRVTELTRAQPVTLEVDGQRLEARPNSQGVAVFEGIVIADSGTRVLAFSSGGTASEQDFRVIPGWVSLLPALLAIVIALVFRNVIPALLVGLWVGAAALDSFSPLGFARGLMDTFQVWVGGAMVDRDRISIILFTMMIGGMVGIITRNGGMSSIVYKIVSRARTAIGGQVAVWAMGMMIFFDDYSNTLVVGNTARSLTDHLRISREKLAYIVDSTAAPLACIALITTWIGYEIGLVQDALKSIPELAGEQAYAVFLQSIPYSFYPIFAIVFVLIVAAMGRDFGPMYKAEVRARNGQVKPLSVAELPATEGDELTAKSGVPLRAVNAILPIVSLIVALGASLWASGSGDTITAILGSADPFLSMMYASFVGVLVAATMTIAQRILSVHETVDAWYGGARATLFGLIILVLAWTLSDMTEQLNTAAYLVSILADSLPVFLVPAIVFVLAAITAFTTGTSWGTMGILMPLIVPLAWAVMIVNGATDASGMHILYSSIACCLSGAVWGDHCSPISDTTVLSSVSSGCNHIEHVRTQLPYALVVGAVAILIGTIPGGFGVPPWLSLLVGVGLLAGLMRAVGRKPDRAARSNP